MPNKRLPTLGKPSARLKLYIKVLGMPLRMRKVLYASLTLAACVVWLPLAFAGIAFVAGAIGLLSIGALLRAIYALPVTNQFSRRYFSLAIGIGIVLMVGVASLALFDNEPGLPVLPVASGAVLIGAGIAVLAEINAKHT